MPLPLPKLDPREQHFRIPSPVAGLTLFLRYLPPTAPHTNSTSRVVLYVHGASFPSALSIAYRCEGRSWRDELADAGFHVWGPAKALAITEISLSPDVTFSDQADLLPNRIGFDARAEGLIDYDMFESITNPGKMLLLTSWKTADDCARWTPNDFADLAGLRHRRVRTVRDYGLLERREAPQYFPEVERIR